MQATQAVENEGMGGLMDRPMAVISRPFWQGAVAVRARIQGRNWVAVLVIIFLMAVIGLMQLNQKMYQVTTADVLEFDPFEVVPDALIGVHLRCIAIALSYENLKLREI